MSVMRMKRKLLYIDLLPIGVPAPPLRLLRNGSKRDDLEKRGDELIQKADEP
jgi:hypothetical protein